MWILCFLLLGITSNYLDDLRCGVKENGIGIPFLELVFLYQVGCGINYMGRRKGKINFVSSLPEEYYPITQREKIEVVSLFDPVTKKMRK